jgi:hypothetical protein
VAMIRAVLPFKRPTDLPFSYRNANPVRKLESKKFFIIAGISPHQTGKINTSSSACFIFD